MQTKLSFSDISSCGSSFELSIKLKFNIILNPFKEVDIVDK